MTVRELLAKLNELPESMKDSPVLIECEDAGKSDVMKVYAQIGESKKLWWEPDAIVLSSIY